MKRKPHRNKNANKAFEEWSTAFKKARDANGDVKKVINAFGKRIPGNWKYRKWKGEVGYRKSGRVVSEKQIEHDLLGAAGTSRMLRLVERGRNHREYPIIAIYHALPLANPGPGQVIADALGVVMDSNGHLHPLLIEVKVTDSNPWFALVECLQQVKMARANENNFQESQASYQPNAQRSLGAGDST